MEEANNMSSSDSDDSDSPPINPTPFKTDNISIRAPDEESFRTSTPLSEPSSSSTNSTPSDHRSGTSPRRKSPRLNMDSNQFLDSSEEDSDADLCTENGFNVDQLLKKQTPKHTWSIVPEIFNRQTGSNSRLQSHYLFQNRCYGSLHCVKRLELMYKLEGHYGCVNSLSFHPNGALLASGSDDKEVIIWDWKLGTSLLKVTTHHTTNVFQSKFLNLNSSDLHIATSSRDGQVRLIQINEGVRENRKLGTHVGPCFKLGLPTDQPHVILSAGEDGLVFSHDIRDKKPERLVTVKKNHVKVPLYSLHTHPLKTYEFCVSGQDDTVQVFDQRKGAAALDLYHPFSSQESLGLVHVTAAVYNYNGSEILASYNNSNIYLFDVNQPPGNFKHQYQGHLNDATIKGVSFFGPKSEFVVSGSDCGNIYFWDRETEAIVQCMLGDEGVVNCLEPHPQVPFICSSGLDSDVKVWVPSCETDPDFRDLKEKLSTNAYKLGMPIRTDAEYQRLWMMLGPLRDSRSLRRLIYNGGEGGGGSDSEGSVTLDSSEEEEVGEPACTLS